MPDPLPLQGPPFAVGEVVVFAPLTLGPVSTYDWRDMVITDVDLEAESFHAYYSDDPERERFGQGFEMIARRTLYFERWLTAWKEAIAHSATDHDAFVKTADLWLYVVAEHPIYGPDVKR
jgi:hypothetical protein